MNIKELLALLTVAAIVIGVLSPLIMVWPHALWVGLAVLAVFLMWRVRTRAGWQVALEEIQRQAEQAMKRDSAAYELASKRMDLLGRLYGDRHE